MMSKISYINNSKGYNKKKIYIIDLNKEIEDIREREFVENDGTYKILVKQNCLYVIRKDSKFEVMPTPYLVVGQKKLEVIDIF